MLDGLATLIVQPNTFPENRVIVASTNPLVPTPPEMVLSSAASIGFPGLAFGKPVRLQMSYEGLSLPSGTAATSLRVFRLWNHRWSILPSTVNTVDLFVETTIGAGGTYALLARTAGNPPPENLITFRSTNGDVSSSWRRVAPLAMTSSNGMAAFFEELSRDADTWRGSELAPTENGVFFVRKHVTGSDFYLAALNGDMPTRFTDLNFEETTGGSMNPTSSTMAFTARIGGIWRLYKMVADGTPPAALVTLPAVPTSAPSINPNGNSVAVGMAGGSIYVYDLTTGAQLKQLGSGGVTDVVRVAFSPTGTKVGFIASLPTAPPGVGEVGSTTVSSGLVQRHGDYGRVLSWDPSGARIVFGERELRVWTVGAGTDTIVVYTNGLVQSVIWR